MTKPVRVVGPPPVRVAGPTAPTFTKLSDLAALSPAREYKVFISHAWDYKDEYQGVIDLLNADVRFRWSNLSVPEESPLAQIAALPKSNRTLVYQIDRRVSQADCVLVLAGMYVAHRGWIQSEIEAAQFFAKPIIAVERPGQERFPEAVTTAAVERVGWTTASIVSAIRKLVGPA